MKERDIEVLNDFLEAVEGWVFTLAAAILAGQVTDDLRVQRANLIEAIDRLVSETELGK